MLTQLKTILITLITLLTLTSCSGGGGIGSIIGVDIVVVDGYIGNAKVIDSNNNIAKYKSNGTYTFTPAPIGEITVSGGFFEDTGLPNTMTYKVLASSRVISPITSFLYKYPHLKQKILTALGVNSSELLGDFVKLNKIDVAKLAQLLYVMNINSLEDDFATTLTNDTDPTDIDDIFAKAKTRVTANNPTRATQIQNFLDVVKAYVGSVTDFEVAIQTEKENTHEIKEDDEDDSNSSPVLNNIASITVTENDTITIIPTATDADNDTLTYTYTGWMSSNRYTTTTTDAGSYIVTVTVSDGNSGSDSQDVAIVVNDFVNANNAPVLNNIASITVTENDTITITPTATDADNDTLTYTYTGWMSSNRYTTTTTDAGSYTVTVTVSDGKGGSDSQDVTIIVNDFVSVQAGGAKLNFSDIISGPAIGLNDSLGSGAIVTVWGNNLGSSQSTSKIYFKDSLGVSREAAYVYYWKNADGNLPSGPANLYESHKMQEVAFSIPEGSADGKGTIYIESNSIVSNTLPFRIRAGNILWVAPAGVNGAACSFDEPCGWINGDLGAYNSSALGNGHLDAGDIVYSRGVEEPDTCGGGACAGMFLRSVVGTIDNPISIISYPGTQAKVKSKIRGIQGYYSDHINISKYHISVGDKDPSTAINAGNPAASNFHISTMKGRYVGNYLDEVTGKCFNGWSGSITSSGNGGSDAKIFGNHFFDLGCDNTSRYQHTLYMSVRSETANAKAWEIGWNYLQDNKSISGIHNYDETYSGDCGTLRGVMSIHDNYIINQKGNGIDVKTRDLHGERNDCWAVDIDIFNNVLINVGLGPKGEDDVTIAQAIILSGDIKISNVNIYNNTIFGYSDALSRVNSTPSAISIDFSRSDPIIKIENNYIHATGDYSFINTSEPNVIENNNLYYSDATQITQDPQCNLNGFDLKCLNTSPLIDAGVNKTPYDIYGIARGTNSDIGAYEYNSYCGDGQVDIDNAEECDDGNNVDGDGCSASCVVGSHYPTILFSDLTAGPNTGWDSNDVTKGTVVTIWGFNFGAKRGNSFISVNGVPLNNGMDYVDIWGEKNNPVPNLESITFQLNNSIPLGEGEITLTVNGIKSNGVDFNVNDGRIFFTDSNSDSKGSGTLESPWKSPASYVEKRKLGDILYFRAGTYDEIYNGGKSNIWIRKNRDATNLKPIAFVGYPNEIAVIDSATNGNSQFKSSFKFNSAYFTVSKLTIRAYSAGVDGHNNVRIVGNDITGAQVLVDGSGIINMNGNNGKALGNRVHGARSQDKLDHGIYISGCAPQKGAEVAWNLVYDNNFAEGPAIVINHQGNRCPSNVFVKSHKVHHNIIDCSTYPTRGIGIYDLSWDPQEGETNEPEAPLIYNNIVHKCGRAGVNYNSPSVYQTAAKGIWFNNIIMDSRESAFSIGTSSNFISTHVYNNIIVMGDASKNYISAHKTGFNVDNNIYYGSGIFPGVDENAINADPKVTVDTYLWQFLLDKSSPAIDAGVTIFDSGDLDINGNKRLVGSSIDIGAIEY